MGGEETSIPVQVIIALAVIAATILLFIKFGPGVKDVGAAIIARLADLFFGGSSSSAA